MPVFEVCLHCFVYDRQATVAQTTCQVQVRQFFRPELLNRLDDIIVFEPLNRAMLRDIARIAGAGIARRLLRKGVNLDFADAALELAVDKGAQDLAYGARPLRRWLERTVVTDLSYKMIAGEVGEGCKVKVAAEGDRLSYEVSRPEAPANKRIKMGTASASLDLMDDEDGVSDDTGMED